MIHCIPFPSLLLGCNRQAKKLPVRSGYILRVDGRERKDVTPHRFLMPMESMVVTVSLSLRTVSSTDRHFSFDLMVDMPVSEEGPKVAKFLDR